MIGPILKRELILRSRLSRYQFFRWGCGAWVVFQLLWLAIGLGQQTAPPGGGPGFWPSAAPADLFSSFYFQQFLFLFLITPVLFSGAITEEKTRNTLEPLLLTRLSSWDIIFEKWLGRSAYLGLFVLTGMPLFFWLGGLADLGSASLFVAMALFALPLLAFASVSLLASVMMRKTTTVVVTSIALGLLGAGLARLVRGTWLQFLDPFLVFDESLFGQGSPDVPDATGLAGAVAVWVCVTAAFLVLSAWRLKPANSRLGEQVKPVRRRWWAVARPPVGNDPIAWKERAVTGLAPVRWLRRTPAWIVILGLVLATTLGSLAIIVRYLPRQVTLGELVGLVLRGQVLELIQLLNVSTIGPRPSGEFVSLNVGAMLIAGLVVALRCAGTVSGEREQGTWEVLLLTPLTARELVRGKFWAILGRYYLIGLAYAVPALAVSLLAGIGVFLQTCLWVGVTILGMYFMGAVGVWCSVRCRRTWTSLWVTLGIGFVGGSVVFLGTTPLLAIGAVLFLLAAFQIERTLGSQGLGFDTFFSAFLLIAGLALGLLFILAGRLFLFLAQRRVEMLERTRHHEPSKTPRTQSGSGRPSLAALKGEVKR